MLTVQTRFRLAGGSRMVAEITPIPVNPQDRAKIDAALGCLSVGAPVVSIDKEHQVMSAPLASDVARGSAVAVLGSIGCEEI